VGAKRATVAQAAEQVPSAELQPKIGLDSSWSSWSSWSSDGPESKTSRCVASHSKHIATWERCDFNPVKDKLA